MIGDDSGVVDVELPAEECVREGAALLVTKACA